MANIINYERVLSEKDLKLGRLISVVAARIGRMRIPPSDATPFESLVRAVIYQRVSAKAGAAVYENLERIAKGKLSPNRILALPFEAIRKAGLAKSKASYVQNLAHWFDANRKTAKNFATMSEEQIAIALTAIPGIGMWTVNVFMVFNLRRLDVTPAPDLGIRRAIKLIYGLKDMPSLEVVADKTAAWKPYRSIASMYLWQAVKLKVTAADLRSARPAVDEAGLRSGT